MSLESPNHVKTPKEIVNLTDQHYNYSIADLLFVGILLVDETLLMPHHCKLSSVIL